MNGPFQVNSVRKNWTRYNSLYSHVIVNHQCFAVVQNDLAFLSFQELEIGVKCIGSLSIENILARTLHFSMNLYFTTYESSHPLGPKSMDN